MIGAGLSSGVPGVPIADIWLSAQGTFGTLWASYTRNPEP
jgi:hypothetical protein